MALTKNLKRTGRAAVTHLAQQRQALFEEILKQNKKVSSSRYLYKDISRRIYEEVFLSDEEAFHAWVDNTDIIPEGSIVYGSDETQKIIDDMFEFLLKNIDPRTEKQKYFDEFSADVEQEQNELLVTI